ncbi:MAG: aldo/keto reductase [Clostridia bacterium]|nr:aldo/keto reductase [Clostridia bacterium]
MLYREMKTTKDKLSILGYGCMRFPQKNGKIDEESSERQIRLAIERGVNYFDTAVIYHGGKSESFLGKVFAKGGRNDVKIATKLPPYMVHSRKDMDNILESQLKKLRTDRIDYYLMHALPDMESWNRLKQLGVLEFLAKAKEDGNIINIGFSYHGSRNDFKTIIDDYAWDFCQIQYNYLDEHYQAGREGLEYAAAKGLGVIIMEPLRGGKLVGRMPQEIKGIWEKAEIKRTPAEWALRWIWNHPGVTVVLSGMSEEYQIEENTKIASDAFPDSLTTDELKLVSQAKEAFERLMKVGCTGCNYCMPCPAGVDIPTCFAMYNNRYLLNDTREAFRYLAFLGGAISGKPAYASLCIECGKCEKRCPQNLEIKRHLKAVAAEMERPYMKPVLWAARKYFKLRQKLKTI